MSIFFNRVLRGNPQDPAAPKKFYPVLKTVQRITEKEVAKQIADETTLNPKEAEMAISQLQKVLVRNLLDSKSVQLGDWGTFNLTANCLPSDTKEGATANNISKLNIRFRPGKDLKNELAKATFIPAENIVTGLI